MKPHLILCIAFVVISCILFFMPYPDRMHTGFLGQGYLGGLGYIVFLYCIISTIMKSLILSNLSNNKETEDNKENSKQ